VLGIEHDRNVGNEAQIGEALFARLAALTLSPVLLVAYPNAVFPAAGSDKPDTYLKASLLRVATQGIGISAWDEHAGILQVDVLYKPQDGEVKPLQSPMLLRHGSGAGRA
jgi:hypothetical protein